MKAGETSCAGARVLDDDQIDSIARSLGWGIEHSFIRENAHELARATERAVIKVQRLSAELDRIAAEPESDDLLELAGELATAARYVVGGRSDLSIGNVQAANVATLSALCDRLRDAVDAYDSAIARAAYSSGGTDAR